ncbi:hypothetical protein CISG_04089 [Coccidioides immitis RMSCC 3703]|uniref:Uncharacterized protein n=1 Tax=Coccidioides immitis RMSCC 3703 TaxID=454286 RepID=A0A0J8QPS8_COCIT|nr:hypothetical protein CISG_04089 [Coccidioides immitis RMSCC 3703]
MSNLHLQPVNERQGRRYSYLNTPAEYQAPTFPPRNPEKPDNAVGPPIQSDRVSSPGLLEPLCVLIYGDRRDKSTAANDGSYGPVHPTSNESHSTSFIRTSCAICSLRRFSHVPYTANAATRATATASILQPFTCVSRPHSAQANASAGYALSKNPRRRSTVLLQIAIH